MDWEKMMNLITTINWEIIVAAVGTIIAAIIGYWQVRQALPKPRTRLKTDLEIMGLIGEGHEQYGKIKEQTDIVLADIYTRPQLTDAEKRRQLLFRVVYAVMSTIFLSWTYYIIRDGWSLWALLTGYFGFASLFTIFYLPRKMRRRRKFLKRSTGNPLDEPAQQ